MKLMVIWGSSRAGRKGGVVVDWFKKHLAEDGRFELDFIDLRELNLPFYDEPVSPFSMASAGMDYTNPQGKAWANRVARTEGVIIITPEYNHGPTGVLKNTLDWVGPEWKDKPVAFISYGGASGGTRAVEQLRTITIELGLAQVANPIVFSSFSRAFDEQGEPVRGGTNESLTRMFDEVIRLHTLLHRRPDPAAFPDPPTPIQQPQP